MLMRCRGLLLSYGSRIHRELSYAPTANNAEVLRRNERQQPQPQPPQLQQQQQKDVDIDDAFLPPGAASTVGLNRLPGSNIFVAANVVGKSKSMFVGEAVFIKSSTQEQQCPADGLPEFAVVGRSNVGKSSLINALVRRKQLAKISKSPGKTQTINHFLIDKSWYLVDLPGYGFAKAPVDVRANWDSFTKDYFLIRKTLVAVLLLVDATVPPKERDIHYASWLVDNKIPLTLVFTKCDKRRKKRKDPLQVNVVAFLEKLKKNAIKSPAWITTSSTRNYGITEVLIHLAQLRQYWKMKSVVQ